MLKRKKTRKSAVNPGTTNGAIHLALNDSPVTADFALPTGEPTPSGTRHYRSRPLMALFDARCEIFDDNFEVLEQRSWHKGLANNG